MHLKHNLRGLAIADQNWQTAFLVVVLKQNEMRTGVAIDADLGDFDLDFAGGGNVLPRTIIGRAVPRTGARGRGNQKERNADSARKSRTHR